MTPLRHATPRPFTETGGGNMRQDVLDLRQSVAPASEGMMAGTATERERERGGGEVRRC